MRKNISISTIELIIYEIDNRPALELIDELLGNDHRLQWKDFSLFVTLGVNKGEKFGPFIEKDYANRLVLSVEPGVQQMMGQKD